MCQNSIFLQRVVPDLFIRGCVESFALLQQKYRDNLQARQSSQYSCGGAGKRKSKTQVSRVKSLFSVKTQHYPPPHSQQLRSVSKRSGSVVERKKSLELVPRQVKS